MSGGSTPAPTQSTTTQISPEAQQLFETALPAVQKFAASAPPSPYPGSTVAGFNPTQEAAQSQLLGASGTTGDIANWAQSGVTSLPGQLNFGTTPSTPFTDTSAQLPLSSNIFSDPGIWNPGNNPGLQAAIDAANRGTWRGLTENALPAVRGGAITAGGYGGSRQGIAEGLATGRATQTAADTAAKIAEDEYNANLQAVGQRYGTNINALGQRYGQDVARYGTDVGAGTTTRGQDINALLAAYGMAPSLQQQALVPGATTGAVGDVQQALQQAQLTGDVSNWNYQQLAPFLQAQELMSLVQGFPGATTTSTGSVPGGPNLASAPSSVLGGAATGAALGSVVPGIGTGVGAAVGGGSALLPFLFH